MTTVAVTPSIDTEINPAAAVAAARPTRRRALTARRAFVVAAPALGGLFAIVGAVYDPAAGQSGNDMLRIYAENPGPLQLKSLGYHWSYAFWIGAALMVAPYVRGKGYWIANVGAFLGFAGMTTLPGLLAVDWYDSAVGQFYGAAATARLHEHMDQTMWGLPVFMLPGMIGLLAALPIAMAGMWRAGLVRWWGFAAALGAGLSLMVFMATWWGAAIAAVLLVLVSVAIAQATRPAQA